MQKDDKITLSLPDGTVRTGTITGIITPQSEPYYVVLFDNGEQYGYFKSEIEENESKARIEKVKKSLAYANKTWAKGYLCGLKDANQEIVDPITLAEHDYLYNYINGDAE